MQQKIRMWEVSPQNTLTEISSGGISLEKRLEDWLESDISMLDPNLLVIGRQVRTDFGGEIDLLCLDIGGALVVVELKKGRTPRDVAAQTLEYASWARDRSYEDIEKIFDDYHKGQKLDDAFREQFGEDIDIPKTLNESHRSLIVAEAMDVSTERIVRYLSDMKVPINVATVQYFRAHDGKEILAQVFLIEPELVETNAQSKSRRRGYSHMSEIRASAEANGVGELFKRISEGASGRLSPFANGSNLGFRPPAGSGNYQMIFDINPSDSDSDRGLRFRLHGRRLADYFGLAEDKIKDCLPSSMENMLASEWRGGTSEPNWIGFKGYFRSTEEIDKFWTTLKK